MGKVAALLRENEWTKAEPRDFLSELVKCILLISFIINKSSHKMQDKVETKSPAISKQSSMISEALSKVDLEDHTTCLLCTN